MSTASSSQQATTHTSHSALPLLPQPSWWRPTATKTQAKTKPAAKIKTKAKLAFGQSVRKVTDAGVIEWRLPDGRLHRVGGAARIYRDGSKEYWQNGVLHRENGPAIDTPRKKIWFWEGRKHRDDGPAVEYANGSEEFYHHGARHRGDGPAIQRANGNAQYWRAVPTKGKKRPFRSQRHCADGPAVIMLHGVPRDRARVEYWLDGELHRADGPAIEFDDGGDEWFREGRRHRLDGPAIDRPLWVKVWYIDGVKMPDEFGDFVINTGLTLPLDDSARVAIMLEFEIHIDDDGRVK